MKAISLAFQMEIALLIEKYHGSQTSSLRSVTYNRLVGGSVDPPSRHINGDAVDASFLAVADRTAYFTECKSRGYCGKLYPVTRRQGRPIYSCHIQRVKPRRRV